jgi:hypothetical protein
VADHKNFAAKVLSAFALIAAGMLIAATLAPSASRARQRNLDLSLERVTDHGVFRIQLKSGFDPIPISKVHQWSLHMSGADGVPVTSANIAIDGGMPEHGHGLPTAPRAASANGPGNYVINGMKFSMTGWWVLKLTVKATDGRTDTITFNVVL